ncbi:50S ribosomal subunit protein L22 [Erysipelotrichaceae bacterium]|nr:50S ribosomal subunit protein L22 [Erysipelotrichaceae bacterium]
MQEAKSVARTVRVTPRKARMVINLIRGKNVSEAFAILFNTNRGVSATVAKVLKSAVANAENNHGMNVENLYVKATFVDEGSTLKRFRPRAKGSAFEILKRTSHITIVVAEK